MGAQFVLGSLYYKGDQVPNDDKEALFWYLKAANQGNATAQISLGSMYGEGRGTTRDNVQAYMWLNLAAAGGDDLSSAAGISELAQSFRDDLEKFMSRSEIEKAQDMCREWLAKHKAKVSSP
jgi:TPR repeat protein